MTASSPREGTAGTRAGRVGGRAEPPGVTRRAGRRPAAGRPVRRLLLALPIAMTMAMPPGPVAAQPAGDPATAMRRLTETQYRNAVADIFGTDIQVAGRLDPLVRPPHGLQTSNVSTIAVSPAGFEQYTRMARAIAAQVVDADHRALLVGCRPAAEDRADDACAGAFLGRVGRLLFRRPLAAADLERQVAAAREGARLSGSFHTGLALSLETMLVSPRFLFDVDVTEPDPARPGQVRLDAWSKAARLSFFLWDTTPDTLLLEAAARGELHDAQGLARQVDRLLASPRLEASVRTLFADMLGFERIADLAKDPVLYPQFVREVKADMPEQTLRTIVELLVREDRDYRELFTSRTTFLTRALGQVYGLPVRPGSDPWVRYELPPDGGRAGLLTQMSFLAAFSHDGRSSPTLRGQALRELLLCQAVPDPPADVDFSLLEDTENVELRTARDRLAVHRSNPVCAGCHRITDPIGLTLENFDGVGAWRTTENGAPIDVSGELDGAEIAGAVALGAAVSRHPAAPRCLARRVAEYALRRSLTPRDLTWAAEMASRFAEEGYRLPALLGAVATSPVFLAEQPANGNGTGEEVSR